MTYAVTFFEEWPTALTAAFNAAGVIFSFFDQ